MPWNPRPNQYTILLDSNGREATQLVRGGQYTYSAEKPTGDRQEHIFVLVSEVEQRREQPAFALEQDAEHLNEYAKLSCSFVVPEDLQDDVILLAFGPKHTPPAEAEGYGGDRYPVVSV